jgi:hypothetical protein
VLNYPIILVQKRSEAMERVKAHGCSAAVLVIALPIFRDFLLRISLCGHAIHGGSRIGPDKAHHLCCFATLLLIAHVSHLEKDLTLRIAEAGRNLLQTQSHPKPKLQSLHHHIINA